MSIVTLQNLCLKVIVSQFERYCELYYSTEDPYSKLKFEFLKKKCSLLILKKLKDDHCLKAKHLDIFINKYLKVLDTRWLREWPWNTICQRLAEMGANLEEVTFIRFDMPWDEVLCHLPNLKIVYFRQFCADKFLVALSKFCKCVETLDVSHSKNVSDNGLMHLCCKDNDKKSPMKELLVERTNVGVEGMASALRNMPFLEKIVYINLIKVLYSMHENDINAFDKVKPYNLTHLNLQCICHDNLEFEDVFTVCVSVCPHLKSLSCPIHRKHHLDSFSQVRELEELKLARYGFEPLELNKLLTLSWKMLTSLKIEHFFVSLLILAQNCPKLTSLEMKSVILQYNCSDSGLVFHNLEKVVIHKMVISKAVSVLLLSAPNLKQLCFHDCDLRSSDSKIHILRCCEQCKLNFIDFSFSYVKFELVKDVLLTCSSLQTLNLRRCGIKHEVRTFSTSLPNKPEISFKYPFNDDCYDDLDDKSPDPDDIITISD